MSLPAAFATKTVQSTCTVWVGAINNRGYGVVTVDGQPALAHRVAYEAEHGPIPEGLTIDHLCRVRNCVRVEHLEVVTQGENQRRGRAASALRPGDVCVNGHDLAAGDIYERPSGKTECRKCRGGEQRPTGRRRPMNRRRAAEVVAAHAST